MTEAASREAGHQQKPSDPGVPGPRSVLHRERGASSWQSRGRPEGTHACGVAGLVGAARGLKRTSCT